MKVRTNMRLLRQNRRLSLRQLDDLTKIDFSILASMERGYRVPTDLEVEKICAALGVTFDLLYPDPELRRVLAE